MDIAVKGKVYLKVFSDNDGNNYLFLMNAKINFEEALREFFISTGREVEFGKIYGYDFVKGDLDITAFVNWLKRNPKKKTP